MKIKCRLLTTDPTIYVPNEILKKDIVWHLLYGTLQIILNKDVSDEWGIRKGLSWREFEMDVRCDKELITGDTIACYYGESNRILPWILRIYNVDK